MHPESLNRIRDVLAKGKGKSGQVRGYQLANRLSKTLNLPVTEVLLGLGILRDQGELITKSWHPQLGPEGMVTLALDIPKNPAIAAWGNAMEQAGLDVGDREALLPLADTLALFDPDDQKAIARSLLQMRENQIDRSGGSRYLASAKRLLGSSKLLDTLPAPALRAFGVDPALLSAPPGYIITAGPSDPACVVLVENPQAMEFALSVPGIEDIAWIATFGYGLSNRGSEQGNQLASLIEGSRPTLHAVVRSGNPPDLARLLNHERVYFWGDLDPEGLRIFWRLKAQLSQLRLSALYTPMIEALEHGSTSHPYVDAVGKGNQRIWDCTDPVLTKLLDLCKDRGVDQESVQDASLLQEFSRLELSVGT